jgi:hypothetical protein
MLIAGSSVAEVAAKLKIPDRTVSEWKALVPAEFAVVRSKKEVIEELLGQYLEETLRANLAQLKVFADETWIRSQTASELATLHGVLFDKAVRVLDAAQRGARQRPTGELLPADGY